MRTKIWQSLMSMTLEEKILHAGSFIAMICVFFPWVRGEWLGARSISYSGFGFFTSFIGLTIFFLHLYILAITLTPMFGGPLLVRKQSKHMVRILCSALAVILTVCVWSVLTKFTFEFSRVQIGFGLYGTLTGGMVATLYSYLCRQSVRKQEAEYLFPSAAGHTDEILAPPPPDDEPEEHRPGALERE